MTIRQQGPEVPHADADAADPPAVLVRADLGQQRVVEDQPRLEADDRDHEQEEREALGGLGEKEGRRDAQDRGDGEEREPACRLVADRAEHRRQDEDDRRGDGGKHPDGSVRALPIPEGVLHQPREVERDDTQAEAGVGEVVEDPARDASARMWCEDGTEGAPMTVVMDWVSVLTARLPAVHQPVPTRGTPTRTGSPGRRPS